MSIQFAAYELEDKELIYNFFTLFSVFEYALKHKGFYTKDRFGNIKPDWNAFIAIIGPSFNPFLNAELTEAFHYLSNHPPKKQAIVKGKIGWKSNDRPDKASDIERLLTSVKTVRNNLFHGGKQPYDPIRDSKLLSACMTVLFAWGELDPEIGQLLRSVEKTLFIHNYPFEQIRTRR